MHTTKSLFSQNKKNGFTPVLFLRSKLCGCLISKTPLPWHSHRIKLPGDAPRYENSAFIWKPVFCITKISSSCKLKVLYWVQAFFHLLDYNCWYVWCSYLKHHLFNKEEVFWFPSSSTFGILDENLKQLFCLLYGVPNYNLGLISCQIIQDMAPLPLRFH